MDRSERERRAAKVVAMLSDELPVSQIVEKLGVSRSFVYRARSGYYDKPDVRGCPYCREPDEYVLVRISDISKLRVYNPDEYDLVPRGAGSQPVVGESPAPEPASRGVDDDEESPPPVEPQDLPEAVPVPKPEPKLKSYGPDFDHALEYDAGTESLQGPSGEHCYGVFRQGGGGMYDLGEIIAAALAQGLTFDELPDLSPWKFNRPTGTWYHEDRADMPQLRYDLLPGSEPVKMGGQQSAGRDMSHLYS